MLRSTFEVADALRRAASTLSTNLGTNRWKCKGSERVCGAGLHPAADFQSAHVRRERKPRRITTNPPQDKILPHSRRSTTKPGSFQSARVCTLSTEVCGARDVPGTDGLRLVSTPLDHEKPLGPQECGRHQRATTFSSVSLFADRR